jgi:hypothetical protein
MWTKYFDEESGREFYYNSFSNESTYDRPAAYVDPEDSSQALVRRPTERGDQSWAK